MPFDRFLIAPINTGMQTDLRPFLIPEDAFALLKNMIVFRGRLKKRFGSSYMGIASQDTALGNQTTSRLRMSVGTTTGGAKAGTVPGAIFKVGQMFSITYTGVTIFFTVVLSGAGIKQMLRTDGSTVTATYNVANGAFNITGTGAPDGTTIFFYPAEPVMGIDLYENGPVNNQPTLAFDTQFAYIFSGGSWSRAGTTVWHKVDGLKFFWATTWQGADASAGNNVLFATNFNATVPAAGTDDPMYYWNGATWTNFSTVTIFDTAGDFVQSALIILPFRNRLVLLNTIESVGGNNLAFPGRCRYSFNGSPLATNAWLEPNQTTGGQNAAGAGFVDAATEEAIIGAEFIKDRLIVFFERSTWELAWSGNEIQPFNWYKLNTELGSESTFSSVPFDKAVLAVGNTGVHACNGSNVERIDVKIPDQIFDIQTLSGAVKRVAGIRDYFNELVYWTYLSQEANPNFIFPNQILVYNYQNASWALYDDTFTAWGYFERQTGIEWLNVDETWEELDLTWQQMAEPPIPRQVIGGNQEGWVVIIDPDESRNVGDLQITNITAPNQLTIIDHTIDINQYVLLEDIQANPIGGTSVTVGTTDGGGNASGTITGQIFQIGQQFSIGTEYFTVTGVTGVLVAFNGSGTGTFNTITGVFAFAGAAAVTAILFYPLALPTLTNTIWIVSSVIDANNITIMDPVTLLAPPINGTYTGGGTVARVSNPYVVSKQWNPYLDKDRNVFIQRIDFGVEKTASGQITVDYQVSSTNLLMLEEGLNSKSIMGTGVLETSPYALYPLEQQQARLWHPVYFQSDGECIQIVIYMSPAQMKNPSISLEPITIEGLVLYTMPTTNRMQ
jgi:hypothetical protein